MATKKSMCPETDKLATGAELEVSAKQLEGLNFEAGVPLKIGVPYLLLPQKNTGRIYNVNGNRAVSKRFWAVEMSGDKAVATRTIGVSSLRGLYLKEHNTGDSAPEYTDLKANDDGFLRVNGISWQRALHDTSFIKGDEAAKRAIITRPVIITVNSRGNVYILEYNNKPDGTPGGDVKTRGNQGKVAVGSLSDRFYRFSEGAAPTDAQISAAKTALSNEDGVYLS